MNVSSLTHGDLVILPALLWSAWSHRRDMWTGHGWEEEVFLAGWLAGWTQWTADWNIPPLALALQTPRK